MRGTQNSTKLLLRYFLVPAASALAQFRLALHISNMSSLQSLNQGAERTGPQHSLSINVAAGQGLAEILKSNLGPRGSTKMLVGGAGMWASAVAEIVKPAVGAVLSTLFYLL
jgi:hypothetical protein